MDTSLSYVAPASKCVTGTEKVAQNDSYTCKGLEWFKTWNFLKQWDERKLLSWEEKKRREGTICLS